MRKRYRNKRNKEPRHRVVRHYVKSQINGMKKKEELMEEYIYPIISTRTYTWWDVKPWKPKVY